MRMKRLGVLAVSAALMLGLAIPAQAKAFSDRGGDVFGIDEGWLLTSGPPDFRSVDITGNLTWMKATFSLAKPAKKAVSAVSLSIKAKGADDGDAITGFAFINKGKVTSLDPRETWTTGARDIWGDVRASVAKNTVTIWVSTANHWRLEGKRAIEFRAVAYFTDGSYDLAYWDEYPDRTAGNNLMGFPVPWQPLTRASGAPKIKPVQVKVGPAARQTVKKGAVATITVAPQPRIAGTAYLIEHSDYLHPVKIAKVKAGKAAKVKVPTKKFTVGNHNFEVRFVPDSLSFATSNPGGIDVMVKKK